MSGFTPKVGSESTVDWSAAVCEAPQEPPAEEPVCRAAEPDTLVCSLPAGKETTSVQLFQEKAQDGHGTNERLAHRGTHVAVHAGTKAAEKVLEHAAEKTVVKAGSKVLGRAASLVPVAGMGANAYFVASDGKHAKEQFHHGNYLSGVLYGLAAGASAVSIGIEGAGHAAAGPTLGLAEVPGQLGQWIADGVGLLAGVAADLTASDH